MENIIDLSGIEGADQLRLLFGSWPSFHDAEVLEIYLSRESESWLKIHTWQITDKIDSDGFLVLSNKVVVTFFLKSIIDIELNGFNSQNVISGITLRAVENGTALDLLPCFGLGGTIVAEEIRLKCEQSVII